MAGSPVPTAYPAPNVPKSARPLGKTSPPAPPVPAVPKVPGLLGQPGAAGLGKAGSPAPAAFSSFTLPQSVQPLGAAAPPAPPVPAVPTVPGIVLHGIHGASIQGGAVGFSKQALAGCMPQPSIRRSNKLTPRDIEDAKNLMGEIEAAEKAASKSAVKASSPAAGSQVV